MVSKHLTGRPADAPVDATDARVSRLLGLEPPAPKTRRRLLAAAFIAITAALAAWALTWVPPIADRIGARGGDHHAKIHRPPTTSMVLAPAVQAPSAAGTGLSLSAAAEPPPPTVRAGVPPRISRETLIDPARRRRRARSPRGPSKRVLETPREASPGALVDSDKAAADKRQREERLEALDAIRQLRQR